MSGVPIIHLQLKRISESLFGIGMIRNITSTIFYLPEGLDLNLATCDHKFGQKTIVIDERGIKYNKYELDPTENLVNIKDSIDFNCELMQPDARALLGDNLAAFVTIRASALYTFSAEKKITANVRGSS